MVGADHAVPRPVVLSIHGIGRKSCFCLAAASFFPLQNAPRLRSYRST